MTWRLIYTRPLAEPKVAAALAELGLSVILPMERVWRGHGHRRSAHSRPLFPSMVFAQFDDHHFAQAAHLHGVSRVVSCSQYAAALVAGFLEDIQEREANHEFDLTYSPPSKFEIGSEVIVAKGNGKGISGQIASMDRQGRAVVVSNLFGKAGKTTVELGRLEIIETPPVVVQKAA